MRWFKHLSIASEDEKLAEILDTHGAEGYGVYWLIVEKIAFLMDGTDRTVARYSVKKWSKFCGKSPKVFRKFLESFQELSLFNVEISENNSDFLEIDCPTLLKFRDEYTKKSGVTPDKLPKKSRVTPYQETETETETEIEIEIEIEKKKTNPKKPPAIEKPESVTEQTWNDWVEHRESKKAKVTQTVINGFITQAQKAGISLDDSFKESIERNWIGFKADWYLKDKNKGQRDENGFYNDIPLDVDQGIQDLFGIGKNQNAIELKKGVDYE